MPNNDYPSDALDASHRLDKLESLEELRKLKSQYAIRADKVLSTPSRAHAVELADLFTEDASVDLGPFGRHVGRAALLHAFENILPAATGWSTHYIANPVLEVQEHHATGTWYFLIYAQAKDAPGGPILNFWGYYEDAYIKVDGVWKQSSLIAHYFMPPPAR
jgi:hypothetical protein